MSSIVDKLRYRFDVWINSSNKTTYIRHQRGNMVFFQKTIMSIFLCLLMHAFFMIPFSPKFDEARLGIWGIIGIVAICELMIGVFIFIIAKELAKEYLLGASFLTINSSHLAFYRQTFPFYKKCILFDDIHKYSIVPQFFLGQAYYRIQLHSSSKIVLLNFWFDNEYPAQVLIDYLEQPSFEELVVEPTAEIEVKETFKVIKSTLTIRKNYYPITKLSCKGCIERLKKAWLFYVPALIFIFIKLGLEKASIFDILITEVIFTILVAVVITWPNPSIVLKNIWRIGLNLFSSKTTITPQQITIKKTKFPFIGKTIIPKEEIGLLQQYNEDKTKTTVEIVKTSGEHTLLPVGEYSLQEIEQVLYFNPENNLLTKDE